MTKNQATLAKIKATKTPVAAAVEDNSWVAQQRARLHAQVDAIFEPGASVSYQRVFVAFIAGMAAAMVPSGIGGAIIGLAMGGAALLSLPTFIILAIYLIGAVVSMWLSTKAFSYAYDAVIDKTLDMAYASAKRTVIDGYVSISTRITGLFTSRSAA